MNSPFSFTKRLILIFIAIIVLVIMGREYFLPDSWGMYGNYRGNAVHEEANRSLVYGTNNSCGSCHEEVYDMKRVGVHHRLSCEICHAPVTEHVDGNKKIADMPVKIGDAQSKLCLTCHQKVLGRSEKFPMIEYPKHLEDQDVKLTHDCNICHTVHAPLESMKYIKKLRTLKEKVQE